MWGIDNRTQFAADRSWIRDRDGAEIWIVAIKATYDILPDGQTRPATEQVPLHTGPVPHSGVTSLRYETDLGPPKAATDILLNGHAYSQTGAPVTELRVGFALGPVKRAARIVGDRTWRLNLIDQSASEPQPFTIMPLIYERAFGGDDQDAKTRSGNPAGCGAPNTANDRLPNIEPLGQPLRHRRDRIPPVAFSPIPSHWPGRARYAGTYDQAWRETRQPLLPLDLDPRFWQIAPEEQQVPGHLRGGEQAVLINLTPPGFVPDGRLAFVLPKLSLDFDTRFYDGHRVLSRSTLHSVILEPDFPRLSIVHHMALPCHARVNKLDRTIIRQKERPLDRPAVPRGLEDFPAEPT